MCKVILYVFYLLLFVIFLNFESDVGMAESSKEEVDESMEELTPIEPSMSSKKNRSSEKGDSDDSYVLLKKIEIKNIVEQHVKRLLGDSKLCATEKQEVKKPAKEVPIVKKKAKVEKKTKIPSVALVPKLSDSIAMVDPTLEKKIPEKKKKPQDFITHELKVAQTLWHVSLRHYGTGFYYPVFFEHNRNLNISNRKKSITLKILKDKQEVKKLYEKFVYKEGETFYYWYQIRQGDTWKRISQRFYGHSSNHDIIKDLNNTVQKLEVGDRVILFLN